MDGIVFYLNEGLGRVRGKDRRLNGLEATTSQAQPIPLE